MHTNYKGNQDSGFRKPPLPICICATSPQLFWWLLCSRYLSQQRGSFALNDTPQKGLQLCFNPGYTHLALVTIAFYFTTLDFVLRGGNKQLGGNTISSEEKIPEDSAAGTRVRH